jgi:hypothetical protein
MTRWPRTSSSAGMDGERVEVELSEWQSVRVKPANVLFALERSYLVQLSCVEETFNMLTAGFSAAEVRTRACGPDESATLSEKFSERDVCPGSLYPDPGGACDEPEGECDEAGGGEVAVSTGAPFCTMQLPERADAGVHVDEGDDEDLGYTEFGDAEPDCDEAVYEAEDAAPLAGDELIEELVRQLLFARAELEEQCEEHASQFRYLRDALAAKDAINNKLSAKLEGLQAALSHRLERMNGGARLLPRAAARNLGAPPWLPRRAHPPPPHACSPRQRFARAPTGCAGNARRQRASRARAHRQVGGGDGAGAGGTELAPAPAAAPAATRGRRGRRGGRTADARDKAAHAAAAATEHCTRLGEHGRVGAPRARGHDWLQSRPVCGASRGTVRLRRTRRGTARLTLRRD